MNIVVLAGGVSTEREVSLSSGTMVTNALRASGNNAILVDSFLGMDVPPNITDAFSVSGELAAVCVTKQEPNIEKLKAEREDSGFGSIGKNVIELCRAADIVYMGLHGEDGENGRIQAFFDVLGIKYTGTGYIGSALAMHKGITKQMVAGSLLMANSKVFYRGQGTDGIEAIKFPCIIKPCCGGSSIGVAKANNDAERAQALENAFRYESEVLVEEFIAGREFSVGVLGDMALPPIEIIPRDGFYDYAHKYQAGFTEEVCPADIDAQTTREMQALAIDVCRILKLEVYARGEFILTKEGSMYFLEMNTLPGMTPTSLIPQEAAAVGISYEELCTRVIELSLAKYR
ncbi:MAG: D-alanine--D-alanine ligase [Christensenella sp.]